MAPRERLSDAQERAARAERRATLHEYAVAVALAEEWDQCETVATGPGESYTLRLGANCARVVGPRSPLALW